MTDKQKIDKRQTQIDRRVDIETSVKQTDHRQTTETRQTYRWQTGESAIL